jgi:alpha-L-rhamnosidase
LTDNGRSDVLAAMFSRVDSPSYGYQLARGATTLTEAWDSNPLSSQNHFMLGHGEEWFYRGLAGLSVNMAMGPDRALQLHPSFLDGISHASASYLSPMGTVQIAWKRASTGLIVDVTVPVGATAQLLLPADKPWREHNSPAHHTHGVLQTENLQDGFSLTLGSGNYHFSSDVPCSRISESNCFRRDNLLPSKPR